MGCGGVALLPTPGEGEPGAGLAGGCPLRALRGEGGGHDSMLRSLMTQSGLGARPTYFPQKSYSGALPPGHPSLPPPAVGAWEPSPGAWGCVRAGLGTTCPGPARQRTPIHRGTQLLTRHPGADGLRSGGGAAAHRTTTCTRAQPRGLGLRSAADTHPRPHPRRPGTRRLRASPAHARPLSRLPAPSGGPRSWAGWWPSPRSQWRVLRFPGPQARAPHLPKALRKGPAGFAV